jgi:hypothetical protein
VALAGGATTSDSDPRPAAGIFTISSAAAAIGDKEANGGEVTVVDSDAVTDGDEFLRGIAMPGIIRSPRYLCNGYLRRRLFLRT